MKTLLAFVFCLGVATSSYGLEPSNDQNVISLDLGNAGVLKRAGAEKSSIQIVMSSVKNETKTQSVPVTRTRQETRQRQVTVDGNAVSQTYTVLVPYTELVEQTFNVRRVVAEDKTLPLSAVKAWDMAGKSLPGDTLVELVAREPVPVIMIDLPWPNGASIDPSHIAVIRTNTLILYVAPSANGRPKKP